MEHVSADEDKYIRRDPAMFSTLLFLVALEIVTGARSVLIVCCLLRVEGDLAAYLEWALPFVCRQLHAYPDPGELPEFKYELETNRVKNALRLQDNDPSKAATIDIRGPVACRGSTSDIVFVLGLKRKLSDEQYRGLVTDTQLLKIQYSRARKSLYALVHDLTGTIALMSRSSEYTVEAIKLGLSLKQVRPKTMEAHLRRQMTYVRMHALYEQIWSVEMQVPAGSITNVSIRIDHDGYQSQDLTPFVGSELFSKLLTSSLHIKHYGNAMRAL